MVDEQDIAGPVLLFDGVCHLCHRGVRFIVKHERDDSRRLRFASLQSAFAQRALKARRMDAAQVDSMIVLNGDRVLVRSDAVLFIAGALRRPWRWARVGRFLPRFLRDAAYRVVAKSRYRLFGKAESCMVPTDALRLRFLDDEGDEMNSGPEE